MTYRILKNFTFGKSYVRGQTGVTFSRISAEKLMMRGLIEPEAKSETLAPQLMSALPAVQASPSQTSSGCGCGKKKRRKKLSLSTPVSE